MILNTSNLKTYMYEYCLHFWITLLGQSYFSCPEHLNTFTPYYIYILNFGTSILLPVDVFEPCHAKPRYAFWRSQLIWIYTVCH